MITRIITKVTKSISLKSLYLQKRFPKIYLSIIRSFIQQSVKHGAVLHETTIAKQLKQIIALDDKTGKDYTVYQCIHVTA